MRFIHTALLLLALVVTGAAASAQTADEIVDKSLAAIGGRAALAKLKSRSMTGKMTISTDNGDIPATFEAINQAPNKMRRLITLDLSAFGAPSATIEQRFDGTTGYAMDGMRGEVTLSASQLENLKNAVFPSPLLDYKTRGTKILLGGREKIGDRDVYALSLTPATGPVTRLFVDAQSYLPVRSVVTLDLPELGPQEQTTDFSDYREVDGVKVPFGIKGTSAVQTFTITMTKVTHNADIDPALFVRPAAK
jgi:outer membrane lipoprotein-sorting protein